MIEPAILAAYLPASVLFCWIAAVMATANSPAAEISVNRPETQHRAAWGVFAALFLLSTAYKLAGYKIPVSGEAADAIFAAIAVFAVFAASAAYSDSPSSVGLSVGRAHIALLFLVPPVALVLFPGGAVNLRLLMKASVPSLILLAFMEELLFRGYLQVRFQAAYGFFPGLMAAAGAATVFRIPMYLSIADPVTAFVSLAGYFVIWGCIAGLIFRRVGNIYGLALLHAFWEATLAAFAGLTIE